MAVLLISFCTILLLVFFSPAASYAATPMLKMLLAPSCPACASMELVLNDLDKDYAGKVATEKINLLEHREIAKQYNVRYVPHLLFLDANGSVFKEEVGVLSLDEVLQRFKEAGVNIK